MGPVSCGIDYALGNVDFGNGPFDVRFFRDLVAGKKGISPHGPENVRGSQASQRVAVGGSGRESQGPFEDGGGDVCFRSDRPKGLGLVRRDVGEFALPQILPAAGEYSPGFRVRKS